MDNVNKRILVVDDDKQIAKLCVRTLTKEGYIVEAYTDPSFAKERISQQFFDLVLSDLMMPEVDGNEILRTVRKESPLTDVIIMTGVATIESAVNAIKAGAYDYIPKPFEIDGLLDKVRKCLDKRELVTEINELKEIIALHKDFHRIHSILKSVFRQCV